MLHRAYIDAQRESHPDKQKTQAARLAALQRSADINAAYRTLKEPLLRAEYLLAREGVRVGGENDTVKPSQALLLESLELRERLMEETDTAPLKAEAETARAECVSDFEGYFAEKSFEKAAQTAIRWRFFEKLLREIAVKAVA